MYGIRLINMRKSFLMVSIVFGLPEEVINQLLRFSFIWGSKDHITIENEGTLQAWAGFGWRLYRKNGMFFKSLQRTNVALLRSSILSTTILGLIKTQFAEIPQISEHFRTIYNHFSIISPSFSLIFYLSTRLLGVEGVEQQGEAILHQLGFEDLVTLK